MNVTRRGLLIGAAAGGGLLVAWALLPDGYDTPMPTAADEAAFGAWLRIARDGVVTVAVPQLEMGQGIATLLPQIVAMELGADWRQMAVAQVPPAPVFANLPLAEAWGSLHAPLALVENDSWLASRWARENAFAATAEGASLAAYELPAREAAAAAREMLAREAADRFDADWQAIGMAGGLATHDGKALTFGELAEAAGERGIPRSPTLRTEAPMEQAGPVEGSVSASAFPRLDLPAKVDGSMQFAADIRLPRMVHAAVRHGPAGRAKGTGHDLAAARAIRGFVGMVEGDGWIAAAAETWWAAERALNAAEPRWEVREAVDSARVEAELEKALGDGEAEVFAEAGEGAAALGEPTLVQRYDAQPALHATLETAAATAEWRGGGLRLWLASQAPQQAVEAVARAMGIAATDIALFPLPAGGSFDRRLEHEHAVQAATVSRELGRPVQLTWNREQESLAGLPRAPAAALMSAKLNEAGQVTAWRARIAAPPALRELGARLFDGEAPFAAMDAVENTPDADMVAGAVPPYGIANLAVEHVPVRTGLPSGRLRGNAHGLTAFFTESFVDELAAQVGREPLSFRMAMLGGDVRLAECLQRAARLAEWGGGRDRSGQGLACHEIRQPGGRIARIACVATAQRGPGGVEVTKLSAAVDLGRIVNRDIARQQVEGGLVYGMGLALGQAAIYTEGRPQAFSLAEQGLPGLARVPEIAVELVAAQGEPADPGEVGVAVVAPAIANALFSATGLRFRTLPLLSEGL